MLIDGRADVAHTKIAPWSEGLNVKVNSRMVIDPEIEDSTASRFWGRLRFKEGFAAMQAFVQAEIAV